MPSTKWKMRTFRQKWYAGETISVAIGQGALTVTPCNWPTRSAALRPAASGASRTWSSMQARKDAARKANVKIDNVIKVIDGMYAVVNGGGTGGGRRLPGLDVCGKTGTAQLASNDVLKGTALASTMKDNAWFVGFAPQRAREIVVVALFEGGEHGNLAAPIVRDVIKAYFDKKAPGPDSCSLRFQRSSPVSFRRGGTSHAESQGVQISDEDDRRIAWIQLQIHPRHRLAAAADHTGDLRLSAFCRSTARLTRRSGATPGGSRSSGSPSVWCSSGSSARSTITPSWARLLVYGFSVLGLIAIFVIGTRCSGRGAGFLSRRIPVPGLGVRQDRAGTAGCPVSDRSEEG